MVKTPSVLTRWPKYPELSANNFRDARVYADRSDMIAALPLAKGGKVAEIGVWRAAFSKVLCATLQPREFVAFDIFTGHLLKNWNSLTGHELFEGLTQRQFYEREMAEFMNVVKVVEGNSAETLRDFTDGSFDLVYVDGDHEYPAVKADADLAVKMVKDDGFLVFNDYMLMDHKNDAYGIVPVVNDLVVNHGWFVVGYAINHALYSDIALQRAQPEPVPEPVPEPIPEPEPVPVAAPPAAVEPAGLIGMIRSFTRKLGG